MKSKKTYLSLLLIFIFTGCAYSKQNIDQKHETINTWSFLKVSQKDLFGDSSDDTIQSLNTLYSQVKITLDNRILTVNNLLLEKDQICSIDYIKIKKTPLAYFYSQKTKDLYESLFSQENIPLSSDIYILTASKPEQECKAPYNELIENDGYLVLIDKDHLLFFTNEQNDKDETLLTTKAQFKDDFPKYCKDVNEGQIFDGSSKYVCNYPNKTLSETYLRMKNIMDDGHFMKKVLPTKNVDFLVQDVQVKYQWIKPNRLRLIIRKDSETTAYLFEEKQNNIELVITVDTGY